MIIIFMVHVGGPIKRLACLFFLSFKQLLSRRDMNALFNRISLHGISISFSFILLLKPIRSINFAFITYIHFFDTQIFLPVPTNLYLHTIILTSCILYLMRIMMKQNIFSVINGCMYCR